MIILGLMMFIAGAFSAGLGGAIVDWDRKDDFAGMGRFAVYASAVVAVIGLVMLIVISCSYKEPRLVRYTIDAHYLNGEVRRITMTGTYKPWLDAYKGTYYVRTDRCRVLGVIHYDLIRTDTIEK